MQKKTDYRFIGLIAAFVLFAASIILTGFYGNKIMTGVRGYIHGEGQWTKAQKEATIALLNYVHHLDRGYYTEFEEALQVIEGDRYGRAALQQEVPDKDLARQGFLQGKNHEADVDAMIWIFLNFENFKLIREAIDVWTHGDSLVGELRELAADADEEITAGLMTHERADQYFEMIVELDQELTVLEKEFARVMNEAAREAGKGVFWATTVISILFVLIVAFMSVSFLRSLKQTNKELTRSEKKFRNVLENSRDVIYQHDKKTGLYDYISSSVVEMLGFSQDELIEGGPKFLLNRVHPEDLDKMTRELENLDQLSDDAQFYDTEFRIKRTDGKYIWVNNKRAPVRDEEGNVVAIVGNVRDISERKEQMNQIDASLKEKQVLLSEIHHRVKNNLAIVSSLIELQKWDMDDKYEYGLSELQSRIKSIALVHEKLYRTETLSNVELAQYIQELTGLIESSYKVESNNIEIVYKLEEVNVDITKAVPVGLICNELINNAFKHGFAGKSSGQLTVEMDKRGDNVTIRISDDSGNLPENFDPEKSEGLGMTLVHTLVKQIEGNISFSSQKGEKSEITIEFEV